MQHYKMHKVLEQYGTLTVDKEPSTEDPRYITYMITRAVIGSSGVRWATNPKTSRVVWITYNGDRVKSLKEVLERLSRKPVIFASTGINEWTVKVRWQLTEKGVAGAKVTFGPKSGAQPVEFTVTTGWEELKGLTEIDSPSGPLLDWISERAEPWVAAMIQSLREKSSKQLAKSDG